MFKNVASQKIALFAFDSATGLPKSGDAANISAYLSKDYGTVTQLTDTSATEMDATNAKGWYLFDVTQTESNCDVALFSGKSSTSGIVVVGVLMPLFPANFTALGVSTAGGVLIQARLKKNTALRLVFQMTDSTTHVPKTGATVTVTRSIDGGAFGASSAGTATEIAYGYYYIDLVAGDLNGNVVAIRATASGSDDKGAVLYLEP